YTAANAIEHFVDELSNWYVRRNRRRFWKSEADADKEAAYQTLYTCLVTVAKLAAPFIPFVSEEIYRNLVAERDPAAAESVHLARWPQVDQSLLDPQLVSDTEALLTAVSLGRAARKQANLKVRQPLSEIWLRASTPSLLNGVRRFEADLRDELNVKAVRYLDASSAVVEYRLKPNLRLVGKKFGKLVPAITAALRDLQGDASRTAAQAVESGQPIQITVDGQVVELLAEEVLVESSGPAGYAVVEADGMLVALNTTVTEELRLEGAARDLVRYIQDARKSAGLAISDRIHLFVTSPDQADLLQATLAQYEQYVKNETLSVELAVSPPPSTAYTETHEFGEGTVTVGVVKAD
ncbi:MAG: class I tRNA ligase family protein, partial [Chloroflexus sp.]|nr:class I tRNA ligase family protein [Chloroflexus sp.]